jgi:hypothetical protein
MLRARIFILTLLLHSGILDSSGQSSVEHELDGLELAYKLAIGRLTSQVTSVNEEEWKTSERHKVLCQRMQEEKFRLRAKRDMNFLKQKRPHLQCVLHDYSPDPQAMKAREFRYPVLSHRVTPFFSTALRLSRSNRIVHRSFEGTCSPLSPVMLLLIILHRLQYILSIECMVVKRALWRQVRPE